MFKNVSLLVCILVFSTMIFGQRMTKDASPCESIKGKTYIGWSSEINKEKPDAAGAYRIVFDANGKGTARQFVSERSTDKSGPHHVLTVTCNILQSAVDPKLLGKPYLQFVHKDGTDAGKAFITSYDQGTKVWVEAESSGKSTKGWMLLLPANPPASENIIK